jgi:thiamine-phosphate pyrophosphorylase
LHLRSDYIYFYAARRLAPPGFLVGRSVHTVAEAAAGAGGDYVIAGTVFPSASKAPSHPLLGIAGLRAIVSTSPAPVLAIGGITPERVEAIAAAGAAGIAAIGLFMRPAGEVTQGTCGAFDLRAAAAAVRGRFDRVDTAP